MGRGGSSNVLTHQQRFEVFLQYLQMKIQERDWHGVADCAMDMRELEAAHPELKCPPKKPKRSKR
jgi:hypothetical protein